MKILTLACFSTNTVAINSFYWELRFIKSRKSCKLSTQIIVNIVILLMENFGNENQNYCMCLVKNN